MNARLATATFNRSGLTEAATLISPCTELGYVQASDLSPMDQAGTSWHPFAEVVS